MGNAKARNKLRVQDNKKRNIWKEMKASKSSYLLIAPYMIFFLVFMIIPIVASFVLSFTYFDMLQPPKFIGIMNYERMFLQDEIFVKVLKNTLFFAIVTGPLSYLLSFMFAWLINELGKTIRTFLTFLFYAPTLTSSAYLIWAFIFSGDSYGVLNGVLISIGVLKEPIQWLSDTTTMIPVLIIVQLWSSLGTAFLSFIAGFQSQDHSLFEAGAIDGIRNRWQELWYISIPQMAPQLMFGAVMQIGSAFSVGTIISGLAGWPTTEYTADTIITYLNDVANIRFEMGYACAIAVFLLSLMLLTNKAISSALSKYNVD